MAPRKKPTRVYGAPWRLEMLAKLLAEAAGPIHRRDLKPAIGTNLALLTEAVACGVARQLGSGMYEDARLPPVDAAAVATAVFGRAGHGVSSGKLAVERVAWTDALKLAADGRLHRSSNGRYSLPRSRAYPSTEVALRAAANALGPVSLAELRALGVSTSTVGNLAFKGRLRRVGHGLYTLPEVAPALT